MGCPIQSGVDQPVAESNPGTHPGKSVGQPADLDPALTLSARRWGKPRSHLLWAAGDHCPYHEPRPGQLSGRGWPTARQVIVIKSAGATLCGAPGCCLLLPCAL